MEQLLDAPERGGFAVFVRRVADPDGDERLPLFQVVVREDESRIFRPAAFAAQHVDAVRREGARSLDDSAVVVDRVAVQAVVREVGDVLHVRVDHVLQGVDVELPFAVEDVHRVTGVGRIGFGLCLLFHSGVSGGNPDSQPEVRAVVGLFVVEQRQFAAFVHQLRGEHREVSDEQGRADGRCEHAPECGVFTRAVFDFQPDV